ncbi:MAG: glycosyltransferase [Bacteroidales bacterium]|nr:glycosyltransferase [Bacteroidales bacterium]
MKVVFLARWYPHRYDPMFGLFVQRHAEAAARYDDVTVIYVHPDDNAQQDYEVDRSSENGVDTIRVYYRKTGRLSSAMRYYKACKKALALVGSPDLIHVHVLTRMGVVAYLQKRRHHTPYLVTEHWSRYLPGNDYHGFLRKLATRVVVRNASMVTTVTDNLGKAMRSHGLSNPNYTILPNVVDTDLFRPKPHHNDIPKIIHISCFEDKSKNISGLLQALQLMKDRGVPFQAVLIGDGMDFEAMKKKAEGMTVSDDIRFTGLLQGQALADELASGDFLVLSSHYENMPVVILEALACGLPVASTRVGGIAEVIDESNGLLVNPDDTQQLADAMEQLCSTYDRYKADDLRNKIVGKYSPQEVGRLLDQWYRQAVKEA